MFIPKGITDAIDANNFTSPPPHISNFHINVVMANVIDHEIIEKKMNLRLFVKIVKIKFDKIPKDNNE